MDKCPLFSIITVTKNSEKTLERTISSVIGQEYPDMEHIIVDGASTDKTLQIIKKYEHLKWISEPDSCIPEAVNKGLSLAKGKYIAMVPSDDFLEPGILTYIAQICENHPEADIIHGNVRMRDGAGKDCGILKPPKNPLKAAWKEIPFLIMGAFIKKSVYAKCGSYTLCYPIATDYDFALKCLKANAKLHYLDKVMINMSLGGISTTKLKEVDRETRDVAIKHGYGRTRAYALYFWKRGFKRAERNTGEFLRRHGLGGLADLYSKVFYPHVSRAD